MVCYFRYGTNTITLWRDDSNIPHANEDVAVSDEEDSAEDDGDYISVDIIR